MEINIFHESIVMIMKKLLKTKLKYFNDVLNNVIKLKDFKYIFHLKFLKFFHKAFKNIMKIKIKLNLFYNFCT